VKERIVVEDLNLDARKEPSCHVILEKRKVGTKRSQGNQKRKIEQGYEV
jgi:hypothetical protein